MTLNWPSVQFLGQSPRGILKISRKGHHTAIELLKAPVQGSAEAGPKGSLYAGVTHDYSPMSGDF